jgi:hypothetical protein
MSRSGIGYQNCVNLEGTQRACQTVNIDTNKPLVVADSLIQTWEMIADSRGFQFT